MPMQALMELGSQICKPVAPDCGSCPLRSSCKAFAEVNALLVGKISLTTT